MSSIIVALVGIVWLVLAYVVYGRFIDRHIVQPDDGNITPAHRLRDGVDFVPAKPVVLFAHHFASIAGAGPIIGPVIAVAVFGFGASLLWILLGVVLIGAVHDYTTLMLSVRNDGQSIPEITRRIIGPRARLLFQVFVWITLIFVVAVFAIAAAKSFMADPRIVIPALGLIPLAMVFGWLVNRAQCPLWIATVIALLLLFGLFLLGMRVPVSLPYSTETAKQVWIAILILYGATAAVLPVWLLLQPRDYIAYWILAFGMLVGFLGVFVSARAIDAPFLTTMVHAEQGPLWPMLFILIACGAVSGFHSLVSSGTTAKQLALESHGKRVAFGGMLTEGALALLALLAVSAGLSFSSTGAEEATPSLGAFLAEGGAGPIAAFATGFGAFTKSFLGAAGSLFGMLMLNAFVLTTLDTSVRLTRFITTELGAPVFKPLKNRYLSTGIAATCAYLLAATGSEGSLWPMFGAANQLVAALAMIVVSAHLTRNKKPVWYTVIPAVFMLLTTCGALVFKAWKYVSGAKPNYVLAATATIMLALAIYVGVSGFKTMTETRRDVSRA